MKKKAVEIMNDPSGDLASDKKQCPACGKSVDKGRRVCPECMADFGYRLKESTIVKFASIFIVIGFIFFAIAAYWETDITKVGDLDKDDNFMIMRFEGKVVSTPKYDVSKYEDYGEMKFNLNDSTGEIQVLVNSKVTKGLIKNGNIPVIGDIVDVEGQVLFIESILGSKESIMISEDGITIYCEGGGTIQGKEDAFKRVTINSIDNIKIMPNKYNGTISISDVSGKPKDTFASGTKVKMSGTVVSEIINYASSYQFLIGDPKEGVNLLVYIPKSLVELSDLKLYSPDDPIFNLKAGSEITILGALEYYESEYSSKYDKWELIPSSVGERMKVAGQKCFQVIKEDPDFQWSVDLLMSTPTLYEDGLIHLKAVKVTKGLSDIGYGFEFRITDPGGGLDLKVWIPKNYIKVYGSLEDFEVDDTLDIWGTFAYYKGWQIKIDKDYHSISEVV